MSSEVFEKSRPGVHPDFYAAEAAGLRWLRDGGASVVGVRSVAPDHIELDRLDPARPTAAAAREFGRMLAETHDSGVDGAGFGCPPEGFDGQIFIGNRPMSSTQHATWGRFYVEERVMPFLRIAVDAGSVMSDQLPDIEKASSKVADGAFDDGDAPARIHGDLWNGNVFWADSGVVLIDPAAHGGHRETDLAMLDLFGCPYLDEVVDGYRSRHELRDGWTQRIPLHQLHPLAVHAAGYGASYGRSLHRAAIAVLRL